MSTIGIGAGSAALTPPVAPAGGSHRHGGAGPAASPPSTSDLTSVTPNANGSSTTTVTDAQGNVVSSSTSAATVRTTQAPLGSSLDVRV